MLNTFKKCWRWLTLPLPFNDRDRDIRHLIIQNNIKSKDIFDIEFGKDFLQKNGATSPPNHDIDVKTFAQDLDKTLWERFKKSFAFSGYVKRSSTDKSKVMFINSAPILGTLGHITKLIDTVGHEHIHILQKLDSTSLKTSFNAFNNSMDNLVQKQNASDTHSERISYLKKDSEIQARLHTIIANETRRWGTLPKTKIELWAMLEDTDMNMPKNIKKELHSKLKSNFNTPAFATKPKTPKIFLEEIYNFNGVQSTLKTKSARDSFWHVSIPYLYGHLLELYGLEKGRQMMGFHGAIDAQTQNPILRGQKGAQHDVADMFLHAEKLRSQGNTKASNIITTLASYKVENFKGGAYIDIPPSKTATMFHKNLQQRGLKFKIIK